MFAHNIHTFYYIYICSLFISITLLHNATDVCMFDLKTPIDAPY